MNTIPNLSPQPAASTHSPVRRARLSKARRPQGRKRTAAVLPAGTVPQAHTVLRDVFSHRTSLPLQPHKVRSPLRYPGGKTWLLPQIRSWLQALPERPTYFVEPFAGGAVASIAAVLENQVDRAILGELDAQVSGFWRGVLTSPQALIHRILSFSLDVSSVAALFQHTPQGVIERAFHTLVRNRVNRAGILAPGASWMRRGERGRGIASRWYAQTLAERIHRMATHASRFAIEEGDGLALIEAHSHDPRAVFFVDPPYTAGGKCPGARLYTHHELDHERLFHLMSQVRGRFLMTYDENPEVLRMVREYGFRCSQTPMRSAHHEKRWELLIQERAD